MAGTDQPDLTLLKDTELMVGDSDADVRGRTAVDRNGEELGEIDGLFVDAEQNRVRFLQVASGGLFGIGTKKSLIPVDAVARVEDDKVVIDHELAKIADAPPYDPELEQAPDLGFYSGLYDYYGYTPFWGQGYAYPGRWY